MKIILIQLIFHSCFFGGISPVLGQDYISFPQDAAVWEGVNIIGFDTSNLHYGLFGDTLIADTLWNKLYKSTNDFFDPNGNELEFIGGIKEDNKYVQFLNIQTSQIDTLYNFNLVVGDTTYSGFDDAGIPLHFVLTHIDTIQLLDGSKRAIYYSTYNTGIEYNYDLIEGIGSTNGLFDDPSIRVIGGPFQKRMTCFSENEILLYQSPEFNQCNIITSTFQAKEELYNVFPNPFNATVTLSAPNTLNSRGTIRIYDLMGKKINEFRMESLPLKLELKELMAGPYVLVIHEGNSLLVYKLVKL